MKNTEAKYHDFREKYPVFTYENFSYQCQENTINLSFDFTVGDSIYFHPTMTLSLGRYKMGDIDEKQLAGIIFHIGLIELISYWKACCSPTIIIKPYQLDEWQQAWWKKLYWKGLGEFFFQNHISADFHHFLSFQFPKNATPSHSLFYDKIAQTERVIVPIGGGKDSVVTLEALRKDKEIIPFIINPRGATRACVKTAGFTEPDDSVILHREISPQLLQLNEQGFLNGHTPFSAMLAFYTLLVAFATRTREIALSNEASANEPTIPNTDINHQYSKSLEFEKDFQEYVANQMNDIAYYYSFLRPYSELEIAEQFAKLSDYHFIFRSCNVGSKENTWCCACPKCLFAYLILSPFIADDKMIQIFGEDLLNKHELQRYFDELTGIAPHKPFECVGTIEEVNKAIHLILESRKEKWLIRHYRNHFSI